MKALFYKFEYELILFIFLIVKMLYELPYFNPTVASFSAILLCGFIAWVLGGIIRRTDNNIKMTVIFFIAFLLASSVFNGIIFAGNFFNRWLILKNAFLVLGLFLTFMSVDITPDKWRIPFICFACCSIQPLFVVFFLPMILTLVFYNSDKKKYISNTLFFCAACILAAGSALLLFGKDAVFVDGVNQISFTLSSLKMFTYSTVVIMPLILILAAFWVEMIKTSTNKHLKTVVCFILAAPFFSLFSLFIIKPPFNFTFMAILIQSCFFFYFLAAKEPAFLLAVKKGSTLISTNLITVFLLLIYLAAFSLNTNNSQISNWLGY